MWAAGQLWALVKQTYCISNLTTLNIPPWPRVGRGWASSSSTRLMPLLFVLQRTANFTVTIIPATIMQPIVCESASLCLPGRSYTDKPYSHFLDLCGTWGGLVPIQQPPAASLLHRSFPA